MSFVGTTQEVSNSLQNDGRCHEIARSGRELAALGRGGEASPMLAGIGDDSAS
jgi:hypothetical protein